MGPATKKIAILAGFPLHALKAFGPDFYPRGHFATWLPQLASAWELQESFEIHWVGGSELVKRPSCHREWQQSFHTYPILRHGRAMSLYRNDRGQTAEILRRIKPDLVHAWGTEDVCGLAGVSSGAPCLLSMQGILTNLIRHGWHPFRVYFQAMLEIFCLRRAAVVSVESSWGKQRILPLRRHRPVEIIEYGVHPDFFQCQWQPDLPARKFLFLGSVCAQKGVQDCVAAFRDPRLAHAQLEIIGSGNPRFVHALQAASPSNVKWCGRQPREVVMQAMQTALGLVLPTRADTSPNVVKEARVVGLPVITTLEGGQTDYIKDEEDGFVVSPGEVGRLVSVLAALCQKPEVALKMGAVGRARYREKFLPQRTAESFLRLYHTMLADPMAAYPHRL